MNQPTSRGAGSQYVRVAADGTEASNRDQPTEQPTLWQRRMLKLLFKKARKRPGEPLSDHAHQLLERIIGNIGDDAVRDFTAVGDVVNTASRLQEQAGSGEVIVSARLARATSKIRPGCSSTWC